MVVCVLAAPPRVSYLQTFDTHVEEGRNISNEQLDIRISDLGESAEDVQTNGLRLPGSEKDFCSGDP